MLQTHDCCCNDFGHKRLVLNLFSALKLESIFNFVWHLSDWEYAYIPEGIRSEVFPCKDVTSCFNVLRDSFKSPIERCALHATFINAVKYSLGEI